MTKAATKALEEFEAAFAKSFGDDTARWATKVVPYKVISTGSVLLDVALGVGGYVEGRLHEVWSAPDLGKTTLALMGAAEAQRKYPTRRVAYIDVENKLDKAWAVAHGVDLARLWIYVPKTAEDVADALKRCLDQEFFCFAVIDSIGAMISKIEQEKDAEEATVAAVPRIVTRMVKIATVHAEKNGAVVLFVNQLRSNLNKYGGPTTLPGGWALRYGTTIKLKLRYTDKKPLTDKVRGDTIEVAREIAIEIERNKCAAKGQTVAVLLASSPSQYGPIGIDRADECASIGIKLGVIPQAGSWVTLPTTGERFQGRDKAVAYLREHPEDIEEIRKRCLDLRSEDVVEAVVDDEVEMELVTPTGKRDFKRGAPVDVS